VEVINVVGSYIAQIITKEENIINTLSNNEELLLEKNLKK
jgi:hypothetical protein